MFNVFNKSPLETFGVDRGRDTTKIYGATGAKSFPSVVGDYHKRNHNSYREESEEDDYEVEINGEKFFVGNLAISSSEHPIRNIDQDKINEETKILTLTAIALMVENVKPRINLGVTLPVDDYDDENQKRFQQLLLGKHKVKIEKNNTIEMTIENVYAFSEGGALLWYLTLNDKGEEINSLPDNFRIIDGGSMTHNLMSFKDGRVVDKKTATFTIREGLYSVNYEGKPTEKDVKNFVRSLVTGKISLNWKDYNYKKEIIYGTGGAMFYEEKYLKEFFPSLEVVKDLIYATAIGLYRLGVYLCQQQVA